MSSPFPGRPNLEIVETEYQRWRQDPAAVSESWRLFFEGFELGLKREPAPTGTTQQTMLVHFINSYRRLGHFLAHLDPLNQAAGQHSASKARPVPDSSTPTSTSSSTPATSSA